MSAEEVMDEKSAMEAQTMLMGEEAKEIVSSHRFEAMMKTAFEQLSQSPVMSVESLCKACGVKPKRFWAEMQTHSTFTPSQLTDWAKAKDFLSFALSPEQKVATIRKRLGFKSESSFWKFTKRVFGMPAKEAKADLAHAERHFCQKYGAVDLLYDRIHCPEQMQENASAYIACDSETPK